jgi:hypothetical protein
MPHQSAATLATASVLVAPPALQGARNIALEDEVISV